MTSAFEPIYAPCYRVRPGRLLDDDEALAIRELAGPRIYRRGRWEGTVEVPESLVGIVTGALESAGIGATIEQSPGFIRPRTWEEVSAILLKSGEIKPSTLDTTFGYQRDGIVFAAPKSGAALWWPAGAGKTRAMILGLLAQTLIAAMPKSTILIVTKANARGQWATATRLLCTERIEPYVLRPIAEDVAEIPENARELLQVVGLGAKTIQRLVLERITTVAGLKEAAANGSLARVKGFGKKRVEAIRGGLRRLRPLPEPLDSYLARMRAAKQRPFIIAAWTSLREWWEPLCAALGSGGAVGWDEVHLGKASKRQRVHVTPEGERTYFDTGNLSSSAAKIARKARFRISATATPNKDRLRDLWAQLDLVQPNAHGTSSTWLKRYCGAVEGEYGGLISTGIAEEYLDELNARLATFVHRVSYEESHAVLLKLKRRESWRLGVDEIGEGWSSEKMREELKAARSRGASAILEVQLAAAAAQIRDPLVERICDDIQSNPVAKICVFDIRHDNVEMLAEALTKAGVCEVLCVHGGNTTPERREDLRKYYMDHSGPIVLVATGDSMGTGIDLHDTDIGYMAGLPWNPGELHQREGRWFRHGMKRPCRVVYCIPVGSIVEMIAGKILAKMPGVELVVGDTDTAGARSALEGTDNPEKIADEMMEMLAKIDPDLLGDDGDGG